MDSLKRLTIAAALGIAVACGEVGAPYSGSVRLSVVPEMGANAVFAGEIDKLVLTVTRDDDSVVVNDTLDIDQTTGSVDATVELLLLKNPQVFTVTLLAINAASGDVFFSGTQTIEVSTSGSGGGTGGVASIPISYTGPAAASIVVSPSDLSVPDGSTYTIRATVYDGQGAVLTVPVVFEHVNPADSAVATIGRLSGVVSIATGAPIQEVFFRARTPDNISTTSRLFIGVTPVGIVTTPGFDNVSVGGTTQLTTTLTDSNGQPIAGTVNATWTSRNPGVATVDANGLVAGVAVGDAIIVVDGSGFTDSVLIHVPTANEVTVSVMGDVRAFAEVQAGDTVAALVVIDMRQMGTESLGSYNATLNWDPTELEMVGPMVGGFGPSSINFTNVGSGELRFAHADPSGETGNVSILAIRFRTIRAGSFSPTLTISELSAAQTFTNLINNVVVVPGYITAR